MRAECQSRLLPFVTLGRSGAYRSHIAAGSQLKDRISNCRATKPIVAWTPLVRVARRRFRHPVSAIAVHLRRQSPATVRLACPRVRGSASGPDETSSSHNNCATARGFVRGDSTLVNRCKPGYLEGLHDHQERNSLRPPMMCRANGSPTSTTSPSPSGRPGSRPAGGVRSRSPRPVADTAPTATAPGAGQPLQERTPPASRTPPIHVRSDEGRGRVPHALRKARAASPDHEGRGDRRVHRTRRGCNAIRYRS